MPCNLLSRLPGSRSSTWLALATFLLVPLQADAFSLGALKVSSALGEPFSGVIPLSLTADDETKELSVVVAAPNEYRLMELDRLGVVADLTVNVTGRKGEKRQVVIHGSSSVREPFFNLLIKSSLGRGAHFRAYRVFLDLAAVDAQSAGISAPAVASAVKSTAKRNPFPLIDATHYGPVSAGETLSSVVRKIKRPAGVTVTQAMAAVWRVNKEKFALENMHGLPVGVELKLPTAEEMRSLSDQDARVLEETQRSAWSNRPMFGSAPIESEQSKQPVDLPPKITPPVAAEPKNSVKTPEYDMRLTVESENKEPAVTATLALQTTPAISTAPKESESLDPKITELLADSLKQLKAETERLEQVNKRLVETEVERDQLKKNLSAMNTQLEKLKREKWALQQAVATQAASHSTEPDWPLLGGLAGGVGVLAGVVGWLLRRRKREVVHHEEKTPFDLQEEALSSVNAPSNGGQDSAVVAAKLSLPVVLAKAAVQQPQADMGDSDEAEIELAGPIHLERSTPFLGGEAESSFVPRFEGIALGDDEADVSSVSSFGGGELGGDVDAEFDAESLNGLEIDETGAALALPSFGTQERGESDELPSFGSLEIGEDSNESDELPSFGTLEIGEDSNESDELPSFGTLEIGEDLNESDELPSFGTLEIGEDLGADSELPAFGSMEIGGDLDVESDADSPDGLSIEEVPTAEVMGGQDEEEELEIIAFSSDPEPVLQQDSVDSGGKGSVSSLPEELEIIEFDMDLIRNDTESIISAHSGSGGGVGNEAIPSAEDGGREAESGGLSSIADMDEALVLEFFEEPVADVKKG